MKAKEFLTKIDEPRVVAAIAKAEQNTTGEIRVYVSDKSIQNALDRATVRFQKLGMHQTRNRNAVLIYFAPRAKQFALVGDQAVHSVCGQAFWDESAALIRARLQEGDFTSAVISAVEKVGQLLVNHFPKDSDNPNELPDRIIRD